jgi:hypothetical protein
MARDQGGVEIDREPLRRAGQPPHALTRAGMRDAHALQATAIARDQVEHPKRRQRRYFLRGERLFRVLYELIRKLHDFEPFFMGATTAAYAERARGTERWRQTSWVGTFASVTLAAFYGVLIAAAGVVVVAIVLWVD